MTRGLFVEHVLTQRIATNQGWTSLVSGLGEMAAYGPNLMVRKTKKMTQRTIAGAVYHGTEGAEKN